MAQTGGQGRILVLCWLTYTLAYTLRVNIAVVIPVLVAERHYSYTQMGLVTSLYFVTYMLGQLVKRISWRPHQQQTSDHDRPGFFRALQSGHGPGAESGRRGGLLGPQRPGPVDALGADHENPVGLVCRISARAGVLYHVSEHDHRLCLVLGRLVLADQPTRLAICFLYSRRPDFPAGPDFNAVLL